MSHSKTQRLGRCLRLELWQCVGLLESIWQVAARETPRGDIGRLSDEAIALAIGYGGDEVAMVDALVRAGWFERSEEHRLVIHNWPIHCQAEYILWPQTKNSRSQRA